MPRRNPRYPAFLLTGAVVGVLAAVVLVLGSGGRGRRPGPAARLPRGAARRAGRAGRRRSSRCVARRPAALTGSETGCPVDWRACHEATDGSISISTRLSGARRTPAGSSASGPVTAPATTRPRSPSSPTSASTPCSTAGRSRPASPSATARRSWSTRTWAWSRRSSTRATSTRCAATSRSATPATPRPGPASGRTPSRPSAPPLPARSRWATTATSPTPATCSSWSRSSPPRAASCRTTARPDPGRDPALARRHRGSHAALHSTTDTEIVTALLASYPDLSLEQAALEVLPQLRGAFSLVFMDEETLYAARDPQGIRPLVLGRLERGWVVASETAALDIVGAAQVREIEPGELIADRRARAAVAAVRRGRAQGLPVRVRLPGPAGHQDRRPLGARDPGRGRPPAGRRRPPPRPTW